MLLVRKKTEEFDGLPVVLGSISLDQLKEWNAMPVGTVEERGFKYRTLISMSLRNAQDASSVTIPDNLKWTPERVLADFDPKMQTEILPAAIMEFNGLEFKTLTPEEKSQGEIHAPSMS